MRFTEQRGYTLLEMITVVLIFSVLVAMASPFYQSLIVREKVRSATNQWQSAFFLAQREAMRLKETVTLCGSSDGKSCNHAKDFSKGWIIIKSSEPRIIQDTMFGDLRRSLNEQAVLIRIESARSFTRGIEFQANGRINNQQGTISICSSDGSHCRFLKISLGGRLEGSATRS
ncbi:MAG: GspH/FimT family pseudopilin [Cardiobacteriaceae bacterium]|nr:GspH/FimT family pseudopilin [Cardiobacteriaceae bacterium]